MQDTSFYQIKALLRRVKMSVLGQTLRLRIDRDCKDPRNGRVFLQVTYEAPCTKTGEVKQWRGRKWYLSDYMIEDEVIKTAFAAFEAAVKHEVMEGFTIDGMALFNPHVDFRHLLSISSLEVSRPQVEAEAR